MASPEFSPEITQDFYNAMTKRISDRGVTRAGQRRSEALSRNLGGDPYEASAVGLADQGTDQELNQFDADLNYRVAGLNRDERVGRETREDEQSFQSAEGDKDRAFRQRMAQLNMDWQGDQANTANRRSTQSAIWQLPIQAGGAVAGGWASGGFK